MESMHIKMNLVYEKAFANGGVSIIECMNKKPTICTIKKFIYHLLNFVWRTIAFIVSENFAFISKNATKVPITFLLEFCMYFCVFSFHFSL